MRIISISVVWVALLWGLYSSIDTLITVRGQWNELCQIWPEYSGCQIGHPGLKP